MNQILQVENKKKEKGSKPAEINNVIIFFAIAILLFGTILLGQSVYSMIMNPKQEESSSSIQEEKPQVNIERKEDNIEIKIEHSKAITKIEYHWNEEEIQTIDGQNKTIIEQTIELPVGTNILQLTVTDISGKETTFQKEYIVEDKGKPTIDLTLTQNNKIKIIAKDERALQYIIYQWNNETSKTVEVNNREPKQIELELEIPQGQNTLKVEALNSENEVTTKELQVKGVKQPKVELTKEGDYLVIKVQDETGLKLVEYTLNGQVYEIALDGRTSMQYKQKLEKGKNQIHLKAYNKEEGITERTESYPNE